MLSFLGRKSSSTELVKTKNPTTFLIDFRNPVGKQDTLKDYVQREANYDIAFCYAWLYVFRDSEEQNKFEKSLNKVDFLVSLLDVIQKISLKHLPKSRKVLTNSGVEDEDIHGKADALNYFGLMKDWTSDQKGVEELITNILNGEKQGFNQLYVALEGTDQHLTLMENGLYLSNASGDSHIKFDLTKEEIAKKIIDEYNKGVCTDGRGERMLLAVIKNAHERENREKEIFSIFLEKIKAAETNENKIITICLLIRDLMQMHLYRDGNGRSLFIFANWLMHINNLPLFYPTNMCIFDANSIDKMYTEITEGQKRFKEFFGTEKDLTAGLDAYKILILDFNKLINNSNLPVKELETINKIFLTRDLNLLFRELATCENKISLMKFLFDNASCLYIDIHEKDKASGKNALDIAREHNNEAAINLLSAQDLEATLLGKNM